MNPEAAQAGMATEEQMGDDPFLHRLLHAQVSESGWSVLSSLVAESWIRLGGASAALLMSAHGADELQVSCCRAVDGSAPQFNCLTLSEPWSILLSPGDVIESIAQTGLVGGLNLQVLPWPDLVSALIVQFPEVVPPLQAALYTTLISVSRNLLSRARDRSILMPRADILEAMAQFAAGAGHEINNPLGSILGQTQILLKSEQAADRKQAFETIGAQAWRVRDMIGNSMLFARPPIPQKERLNAVEVVQQTLTPIEKSALNAGVEIRFATSADEIHVVADRSQLSTLVSHLIRNSVESLRGADRHGCVSVTLRDDLPGTIELSVVDDGPGIVSEEVRQHLFNPFYSGRSAGRGLGFGLCLAWQIVRMHGGMILHETPEEGGAAFHIALPCE
ncbi:MAG: HAMP domain-containing histidine kinase [Planctomycetaceae bacterium]|nr:HAMP domain-containing histidine kinase [Planctomycetaceae bacterium]